MTNIKLGPGQTNAEASIESRLLSILFCTQAVWSAPDQGKTAQGQARTAAFTAVSMDAKMAKALAKRIDAAASIESRLVYCEYSGCGVCFRLGQNSPKH